MKLRKLMAGTLAATMVLGSSMMAFAEAQSGEATGTGSSVGHVDKEVLTVTLPSGTDNVFDYYVDPERVIDLAGSLSSGTKVDHNADGVYFKNGGASGTSFSSSSDEVKFIGKNSVAVDVSVAATVVATEGGKDITLVGDNDALTAATTPALLMNLTVGTETRAITSDGATAKATLDGVDDNFEVVVDNGAYKYQAKASATEESWSNTTVKLSGKTNKMDVPTDMTAPKIKLTWTIEKHLDSYLDSTTMSASSNSVELTLPNGITITKAEITHEDGTGSIVLSDQYTLNGTTFTIPAGNITAWTGLNPAYTKLVLTFSDNKSETITLQ